MDAKHTPGPWRVEDDTFLVWGACQLADDGTIDFLGIPVARAETSRDWERHYGYQRKPGEEDANARLIAAAPELLAALELAEKFVTNGVDLGFIRMPDASTPDSAHGTLPAIRAAIAKAKGEA